MKKMIFGCIFALIKNIVFVLPLAFLNCKPKSDHQNNFTQQTKTVLQQEKCSWKGPSLQKPVNRDHVRCLLNKETTNNALCDSIDGQDVLVGVKKNNTVWKLTNGTLFRVEKENIQKFILPEKLGGRKFYQADLLVDSEGVVVLGDALVAEMKENGDWQIDDFPQKRRNPDTVFYEIWRDNNILYVGGKSEVIRRDDKGWSLTGPDEITTFPITENKNVETVFDAHLLEDGTIIWLAKLSNKVNVALYKDDKLIAELEKMTNGAIVNVSQGNQFIIYDQIGNQIQIVDSTTGTVKEIPADTSRWNSTTTGSLFHPSPNKKEPYVNINNELKSLNINTGELKTVIPELNFREVVAWGENSWWGKDTRGQVRLRKFSGSSEVAAFRFSSSIMSNVGGRIYFWQGTDLSPSGDVNSPPYYFVSTDVNGTGEIKKHFKRENVNYAWKQKDIPNRIIELADRGLLIRDDGGECKQFIRLGISERRGSKISLRFVDDNIHLLFEAKGRVPEYSQIALDR